MCNVFEVKKIIAFIFDLCLFPFKHYFLFWVIITIFMSLSDIYYFILYQNGAYYYSLYLLLQAALYAYVISLIIGLPKSSFLQNILRQSVLIFLGLFFVLEFVSVVEHGNRFNGDFICILFGTNISESREYLESLFDIKYGFVIVISLIILFLGIWGGYKFKGGVKRYGCYFSFGIVLVSFGVTIHNSAIYDDGILAKLQFIISYQVPEDLRLHYKHPVLDFRKDSLPQNVVLIIGESLTKHHCSLYGYDKPTNPLLSSLRDSSSLIVFKNVTSPGTSTVQSFKFFMSTHKISDKQDWYSGIVIPEIVEIAGYKSHWISNQASRGVFDNVIRRYAELCSDYYFNGDSFTGLFAKTQYDEDLIRIVRDNILRDSCKVFTIVNLMGNHFDFNRRYPATFNRFKATDYPNNLPTQRQTLAEYDNSVLYNDSVVYELMKAFHNEEAIVFYFPDHGLDLFYTSDDYAAHAKQIPESQKVGKEIPFIIYITDRFRKRYPLMVERMQESVDKQFCTDDLIYALMDIMNIRFHDNKDVDKYSLFR